MPTYEWIYPFSYLCIWDFRYYHHSLSHTVVLCYMLFGRKFHIQSRLHLHCLQIIFIYLVSRLWWIQGIWNLITFVLKMRQHFLLPSPPGLNHSLGCLTEQHSSPVTIISAAKSSPDLYIEYRFLFTKDISLQCSLQFLPIASAVLVVSYLVYSSELLNFIWLSVICPLLT